jgi:hypothetical protein
MEIQSQIAEKNQLLQEKMQKIKEQQLLQKQRDKEKDELKTLIKSKLTKKYQSILEETKKYEKFVSDKNTWKINRENLSKDRRKMLTIIFDEKISFENIFLKEQKKTSAFALSEYFTYFPLEYKSLLGCNNINDRNNMNSAATSILLINESNHKHQEQMMIEKNNSRLADNYHAISYLKNNYRNKNISDDQIGNKNLDLDHLHNHQVNKSNLIDIALKEMDIEDSNFRNYKAKVNNIIIAEDREQQHDFNNKQDTKLGLKAYFNAVDKQDMIISDYNTKIMNNPNLDNEIIVYEFIKANFVLSLIDKVIIEKPQKKDKTEKGLERKKNLIIIIILYHKSFTLIFLEKTINKQIYKKHASIKDTKELSIADEIFEMVNTIESVINSGFVNINENKTKNKSEISKKNLLLLFYLETFFVNDFY